MKIVIDLDGTICPIRKENESYSDLIPLPYAVEKIRKLKADGHYIIIQTARNMGTQNSNIGRVMRNIGKITLEWLDKYDVVYDEIYFGKPNGDLYIDDRALRFKSWDLIDEKIIKQLSKEK